MNNKAIMVTTALILALSAVSCGKEDSESSVSIAYGEATRTVTTEAETETTKAKETTIATGKTTKAVSGTGTATATTTSAVSGTETVTTDSSEETSTEATTSAENSEVATTTTETTAVTNTTVQAETTAPETTVETTTEDTTENNTPAPDDNSDNDDDNNNNNDDDNNNNNDNNDYTSPAVTLAPDNPEPATATRPADNTFEFKFTVDNLLNDASGLLAMLDTPTFAGEAPGCTSNGNDVKIYQYDGLEIQCYIDGATEYIFSIEITGDKYITDHDIKVGCTRAEVESAYGTGETSGNMTVYYTGNNEMDIEYDGDTVKSIFFYAPV